MARRRAGVGTIEPYLSILVVAALGLAIAVAIPRGNAFVRAALAAVVLLPVHTALIALRPQRGCLVSSSEDCIRDLHLPGDLWRAHVVLAACAAAGLIAFYTVLRFARASPDS